MDYEKKYKEALDWARKVYPHTCGNEKEDLEHFFPELKESEDERIRKFLVDILSHGTWRKEWPFGPNEVVAYLEKQKEQKPVDMSELMVHKEPYIAPVPIPIVADEQKPAEWSEEERIRKGLIEYLESDRDYQPCQDVSFYNEAISWLKSIRPQPHWKPSKEQMDALNSIILIGSFTYVGQAQDLISLKDELKKL